jgi:hypothetical protein
LGNSWSCIMRIAAVYTGHLLLIFSVALQSLVGLTYRRFLELFRHMVGLLRRVISPSQGLYLRRTTQHRKMRTNIHALSGIRTHDPSNQPAKTHASDRTAIVTGSCCWLVNEMCEARTGGTSRSDGGATRNSCRIFFGETSWKAVGLPIVSWRNKIETGLS